MQVMWHSGMSTNKYEFVLLESGNVVVKHLHWRVLGKSSLTEQLLYCNDFSNTYYHPVASPSQRNNPVFTGTVYIFPVLYYSLDTDQRNYLASSGLEVQLY